MYVHLHVVVGWINEYEKFATSKSLSKTLMDFQLDLNFDHQNPGQKRIESVHCTYKYNFGFQLISRAAAERRKYRKMSPRVSRYFGTSAFYPALAGAGQQSFEPMDF